MKVIVAWAVIALLLIAARTPSASQTASPPSQPEVGPGGKQASHSAVVKKRYRQGAKEYWIYEPDSPKPVSAPLVVFLHGWGGTNPLYYGAWIDHLVKRGKIVVFPRYQSSILTPRSQFIPNTLDAVKDAVERLKKEPGHVRPDLNKVAVVGHSLGGLLAASVAALAAESGLPQVRVVMAVQPGITEPPANVPVADFNKIPADTLLLSVVGDRDSFVGDTDAKRIYYESTRVTADNKDFVTLSTDQHGTPELIANHRAPTAPDSDYDNGEGDETAPRESTTRQSPTDGSRGPTNRTPVVNALDYFGLWKLFDGLCDAAFYQKNREYALGNTPQQRFMGRWSDGVPVKELSVTDKP
jgi:pimeloyl-ACP methyl ester carboxylesterase